MWRLLLLKNCRPWPYTGKCGSEKIRIQRKRIFWHILHSETWIILKIRVLVSLYLTFLLMLTTNKPNLPWCEWKLLLFHIVITWKLFNASTFTWKTDEKDDKEWRGRVGVMKKKVISPIKIFYSHFSCNSIFPFSYLMGFYHSEQ